MCSMFMLYSSLMFTFKSQSDKLYAPKLLSLHKVSFFMI